MATIGDVPTLLARLRGRSKVQQAAAARALSELSGKGHAECAGIAAEGGIAALAQVVRSSGSAAVQQHAITALVQMAFSSAELQAPVVASGVIPALVQLMRQPGAAAEVAVRAVCCLTILQEGDQGCAAIAAAGGVPTLVYLLESGVHSVQQHAALIMHNMASRDSCYAAAFAAAGAVHAVVSLLAHGDPEQQRNALLVIANLVCAPEGAAAAMEAGALPLLVGQLESHCVEVRSLAVWTLQNIIADADNFRQALLEHPGALASLVSLLNDASGTSPGCSGGGSSSSGGTTQRKPGIGSMSQHRAGIGVITIDSDDFGQDVTQHAVGTLHNLAGGGLEACSALIAAGAVPPLVQLLLTGRNEDTVQHALLALTRLSGFPACRPALLEAGVLPALQHVQQHSTQPATHELVDGVVQLLTGPAKADGGMKGSQAADADAAVPAERETAATAPAAAPLEPAYPPAPRICAAPGCGTTRGLRRCGGCGTVRYCSEACCKAHWWAHKAECRRLQAEWAAAADAS